MKFHKTLKWVALGLLVLALSEAPGAFVQAERPTVWIVCPAGCQFSKIQDAIDTAKPGDFLLIGPGVYLENLRITKSVTLQGVNRDRTFIHAAEARKSVVLIDGTSEIEVFLEGLTVGDAKGVFADAGIQVSGHAQAMIRASQLSTNQTGVQVSGHAQATIRASQLSTNEIGLLAFDSARVSVSDSQVSDNFRSGVDVFRSAQVSLTDSQVSGTLLQSGLFLRDSAQVSVTGSQVSGNYIGVNVGSEAQVSLTGSQVSHNWESGLYLKDAARAEVRQSLIAGNGAACLSAEVICNGVSVRDVAQLKMIDSVLKENADWGVAAWLKICGYKRDFLFFGHVVFEGTNTIAGNNKSGNQNGMGNPGNHPWNRPEVPDGQVCLP